MTPRRRGYSLVELIFGLATTAVLLGGLTSAMMIATKSLPHSDSPLDASLAAGTALEIMSDDLLVAQGFNVRSATIVEFTVADRNNDAAPDTIRYEWSGVAGAPLKRRVNAGGWNNVADDVQEFSLAYESVADTSVPPAATESGETKLAGYTLISNLADWAVTNKNWVGQYFLPTLPGDATSWKVTRVRVNAKLHGSNGGITRVALHAASSGKPSGAIIDEAIIWENVLSDKNYLWQDVTFASATGLSPGSGLCLVLQWIKDADAADFQYRSSGAALTNSAMVTTLDGGASWSTASGQSLLFEVFGTYTSPSVEQPPPPDYLTAVRIRLRVGDNSRTAMENRVTLLNEPTS